MKLIPPIVVALTAATLFLLERRFPLRRETRVLISRLAVNLAISVLTFLVAWTLVQPAAHAALHRTADKPFGITNVVKMPLTVQFIVSFLLMDLIFYYWHLANHRVPWLWRFHNVHHIDPDLDVSSAFRFHVGEIGLSAALSVFQITFIGISAGAFFVYQMAFQAEVLFHHSNWRLPIGVERALSKVIVTPRMHGIHHSQVQRESNSNFGTIFSFWDRIHRTLGLNIPQSQLVIGVPAYSGSDDNTLGNALLLPFRKQRDYWSRPDGSRAVREQMTDAPPTELAE